MESQVTGGYNQLIFPFERLISTFDKKKAFIQQLELSIEWHATKEDENMLILNCTTQLNSGARKVYHLQCLLSPLWCYCHTEPRRI
jgi:hypothetical protein